MCAFWLSTPTFEGPSLLCYLFDFYDYFIHKRKCALFDFLFTLSCDKGDTYLSQNTLKIVFKKGFKSGLDLTISRQASEILVFQLLRECVSRHGAGRGGGGGEEGNRGFLTESILYLLFNL